MSSRPEFGDEHLANIERKFAVLQARALIGEASLRVSRRRMLLLGGASTAQLFGVLGPEVPAQDAANTVSLENAKKLSLGYKIALVIAGATVQLGLVLRK